MTQINSISDIPALVLGAADVLVNAALEKIDDNDYPKGWIEQAMVWHKY